jgi:hypothetical protein
MNAVDSNLVTDGKPFIFGEEEISRMYRVGIFNGIYSYFLLWLFSALLRHQIISRKLSKKMELARSALSGFIIFIFCKLFDTKVFYLNEFSSVGTFILNNFASLIMSTLCIFISVYIYLRRKFINYHNDDQSIGSYSISNNSNFKNVFNSHYAPTIYIAMVLYHSFFAGLGFSGHRYYGWFEIIIFLQKIFEIYRIKRSFNILQVKKEIISIWMFLYVSIFVFGILTRGFISFIDIRKNTIAGTSLCDIFSAQSFIFMVFFETLIPFPIIFPDLIFNLIVMIFSYTHFCLNITDKF